MHGNWLLLGLWSGVWKNSISRQTTSLIPSRGGSSSWRRWNLTRKEETLIGTITNSPRNPSSKVEVDPSSTEVRRAVDSCQGLALSRLPRGQLTRQGFPTLSLIRALGSLYMLSISKGMIREHTILVGARCRPRRTILLGHLVMEVTVQMVCRIHTHICDSDM